MKNLWARYADRIDRLTLRERVMVFACAMVVMLGFVFSVYIDPQMQKEKRLSALLAQKQAESRALQDQATKVATSRGQDPDRPLRERIAAVRAQLAETDARIGAEERKFTQPSQMRRVIEELIARNRGIELEAMKSLPTASIAEARAQAGGQPAGNAAAERLVYRHGIEITVSGKYLDLLGYLADLERMPSQLYWSSLEIDATRYPKHTMKLVVYTLSLDRAWLNV